MRGIRGSHRARTLRGLAVWLAVLMVLAVPACTSSSSPADPDDGAAALEGLPRIPWEGGPAYWKKFRNADKGGWDRPSFFPIAIWFDQISTNAEVRWDKAHGVNTYFGLVPNTPFSLIKDNHVYYIGPGLNSGFDPASGYWVGNFLGDEYDGRYSHSEGQQVLARERQKYAGNGKFDYANYTGLVVGPDMPAPVARAYVNRFTDVVSVDTYLYTVPFCDWRPYRGNLFLVPIPKASCRTASSYGRLMQALRQRDASDGRLQPLWQFIELLNGGSGDSRPRLIAPDQLRGAVMSSLINEARGIFYFNQSMSGPCFGGNVLRSAQLDPHACGATQVQAMKVVDSQIRQLAPVLNTQSYRYRFGPGLQTMLKARDGYAYVFAMVDGNNPGRRTFRLPSGVRGTTASVLFEGRSIPVHDGTFSDVFRKESSYHVYRIAL